LEDELARHAVEREDARHDAPVRAGRAARGTVERRARVGVYLEEAIAREAAHAGHPALERRRLELGVERRAVAARRDVRAEATEREDLLADERAPAMDLETRLRGRHDPPRT